jgi:hypothetical protein
MVASLLGPAYMYLYESNSRTKAFQTRRCCRENSTLQIEFNSLLASRYHWPSPGKPAILHH